MSRQRFIAALSGAVVLCGIASWAAAAPVTMPAGDWVIGPIRASSSSGVGYCSMKNDYQDGRTLVFAQDAEGSNSLAVDFHKKVLQTGGQYKVGLQAGRAHRMMFAVAATPSVMLIQLGLDRSFYLALQRKDALVLDFETSQLSFSLAGAQEGLVALNNCSQAMAAGKLFHQVVIALGETRGTAALAAMEPAVGGLVAAPEPAVPVQAAVATPAPAAAAVADAGANATLGDELKMLRDENLKLLQRTQAVADRLQAEEEGKQAALSAENAKLKAALASIEQEKIRAQEEARYRAEEPLRQAAMVSAGQWLQSVAASVRQEMAEAQAGAALVKPVVLTPVLTAEAPPPKVPQPVVSAESDKIKATLLAAQQEREHALAKKTAEKKPHDVAVKAVAKAATPEQPKIVAKTDSFLKDLLKKADVKTSRNAQDEFAWNSGGVQGAAQMQDMSKGLNAAVDHYIQAQGSRCHGDFAHKLGVVHTRSKSVQTMESEMACMDGHHDTASAVLFVVRDGKLAIISQAVAPTEMEKALARRDAMISAVSR